MKPQPNTKHDGWFSNPGAINAGLLAEKGIRLPTGYRAQSQLEAALLKEAEGPGRIEFKIRTVKPKEASASSQRKAWASLIAAANHRRS